ncbi:hypothetical protein INT80_05710 [Gallibacterium anatis]|uniref:Uncharacterized protein n=1 Tax=Gallibacterium anatis TaxID=750 RepID=A0A930Y3S0_9PAST|nr:hypothetical protein [Gallibacterium anatis]
MPQGDNPVQFNAIILRGCSHDTGHAPHYHSRQSVEHCRRQSFHPLLRSALRAALSGLLSSI